MGNDRFVFYPQIECDMCGYMYTFVHCMQGFID